MSYTLNNFNLRIPNPQSQQLSAESAMEIAFTKWKAGESNEAAALCKKILEKRPMHQGAKHLLMMSQYNVTNIVFTSVGLVSPQFFDIGDFSYGLPIINFHNQPSEAARLIVGNYCAIGHNVEIFLGSYHRSDTFSIFPFSAPNFGNLFANTKHITDYSSTKGNVIIGNDVWIGAGVKIMSGVTIGDGAVIGAGSVVSKNVRPYEIWVGNPAHFVKRRFELPISERLLRLRWWDWPKDVVEANAREIMSSSPENLDHLEKVQEKLLSSMNNQSQFKFIQGYSSFLRIKMPVNFSTSKPNWLILHGFPGSIETASYLSRHVEDVNLFYLDIPGFGDSQTPREISISGFASEILPALLKILPGDYRILGISFGGNVGLEIARHDDRCKGVMLLDTPFSSLKLTHNHNVLRRIIEQRPDDRFIRRFAHEIFGVTDTTLSERDMWSLLDGQKVPIIVVTGDVPMSSQQNGNPTPCYLDEDDLTRLKNSGVIVKRIMGGHNLLDDSPKQVSNLLSEMV